MCGLFGRLCKSNLIRSKETVGWNLMEKGSDDFGRTEKGLMLGSEVQRAVIRT